MSSPQHSRRACTRPRWQRGRSTTASCRWRPQMRTAPLSTARSATTRLSPRMCPLPSTGTVSVALQGCGQGASAWGNELSTCWGGNCREKPCSHLWEQRNPHTEQSRPFGVTPGQKAMQESPVEIKPPGLGEQHHSWSFCQFSSLSQVLFPIQVMAFPKAACIS